MTKVIFYHKLNPNHRKHGDGSAAASKRRSLLQTPIPPQNGILYNGKCRRSRPLLLNTFRVGQHGMAFNSANPVALAVGQCQMA